MYFNVNANNNISAVFAEKNDLLLFMFDKKTIVYLLKDGNVKELKFKNESNKYYLNDKLIAMDLSDDVNQWDEILKMKKNDLKNLQSIMLYDEIEDNKNKLKELANIIPDNCFVNSYEYFKEFGAKIKPDFLLLVNENGIDAFLKSDFINKKNYTVKNIILEAGYVENLNFLSNFKSLESLTLHGWDSSIGLPKDLKIKNLSIINSKISNLEPVKNIINLEKLTISVCEEFGDAAGISGFKNLKALDFSYCNNIANLDEILKLKKLKYLSLPEVDQQFFNMIPDSMNNLTILELIGSKEIKDLSGLKKLKNLNSFIYLNDGNDYKNLYELKNLKYLFVSNDFAANNPALFEELKKALDKTEIFTVSGICLGAGYIILILIGLAVLTLFLYLKVSRLSV